MQSRQQDAEGGTGNKDRADVASTARSQQGDERGGLSALGCERGSPNLSTRW